MSNEALIKEVYASFGLAYYMSECVYRGLIQVLAVAGPCLSRPRVEERFKVLEEKTMGPLIAEAKTIVPPDLHSALDWALERRNFLAHCFWFENLQQLAHHEGMKHLVFELMGDVEQFKHLGRALDYIAFTKLGVDQDTLQQCIEQAKQARLQQETIRNLAIRFIFWQHYYVWSITIDHN